jgi:hypothetical protein
MGFKKHAAGGVDGRTWEEGGWRRFGKSYCVASHALFGPVEKHLVMSPVYVAEIVSTSPDEVDILRFL